MHISRGDVSLCEEMVVSSGNGKMVNCSSVVVGDSHANMKKRKLSSNKGAVVGGNVSTGGVLGLGNINRSDNNVKNSSNVKHRNTSRNHHSSLSLLNRSSLEEEEKFTEVDRKKVDKAELRGDRGQKGRGEKG